MYTISSYIELLVLLLNASTATTSITTDLVVSVRAMSSLSVIK